MEKPWLDQSFVEKVNFIYGEKKDCTFLVGMKGKEEAKEIKSFKLILSSISPAFERMFNGDFKEAKSDDPIAIEDIYFSDFELFLKYVYNEVTLIQNWKSLYKIAKKYLADGIIAAIIKELELKNKTPLRMLYLFEILDCEKKFDDKYDSNVYKSVEISTLQQIIETPRTHLFNLNPSVFLNLVRYIKSEVSAIKIFTIIETYCSNDDNFSDDSQKAQFKAALINEINFSAMTSWMFVTFASDSDLLDSNEKLKILTDICLN